MKTVLRASAILMILGAWAAPRATAAPITLRLVQADNPAELVSAAVTEIKFQEELDAEAAIAQGLGGDAAKQAAEKVDTEAVATLPTDQKKEETKSEFDRYVNYMRGILIDGKHPFQKMYKGSYLGRSAEITLDLDDGPHTVDPGGHTFAVNAAKTESNDPDIACDGTTLNIKAYPVTFIAVDAAVVRPVPAELRRLPLRPMIYFGSELLLPLEKRLSSDAVFKRLTLYMLGTAKPYRLEPTSAHFVVGSEGVRVVGADGKAPTGGGDGSVMVEDNFTLVLPQMQVPLVVKSTPDRTVQVLIAGDSGRAKVSSANARKDRPTLVRAFSSEEGSTIKIGNRVQTREVPFHGDLFRYPLRQIVVDATAADADEPRMMVASWARSASTCGESLEMRIQYVDSLDRSTISPVQIAAFHYDRGLLNDDGTLGESGLAIRPDPAAAERFVDEQPPPHGKWVSLPVAPADQPDTYSIRLPNVRDNVYKLRVVCDRRGEASPESALRIEFAHAITGANGAAVRLSVFTPAGRHAFRPGEPLEISVAASSAEKIAGGKLTLDIEASDASAGRLNLVSQDVPAVDGMRCTWSFEIPKGPAAVLRPGEYVLVARLGQIVSNRCPLTLPEPKYDVPFHYYNHTWGGPGLDMTSQTFANIPPGIDAANLKLRDLETNCRANAGLYDLIFEEWSVFRNFDLYGGRDDSSEIAGIEQVLRASPSLPAHEVYYYQNHFEVYNEALARHGLGHMNDLLEGFSPRSLMHSVKKDFEAKMRQYQLTAQLARRFPNFIGWSIVKDDTNPIGDSEVGDKGRSVRLYWQRRNFIEKYKYEPPTEGDAVKAMYAIMAGKGTEKDVETCTRYEAWTADTSNLLGHYYETAKQAVKPLAPELLFANLGPGVAGAPSSGFGSYPPICFKGHDILSVQTGTGDYGFGCVLDPYNRTRIFQTAPEPATCWGIIGNNASWGIYNVKYWLAQFLASGSKSIGHYNSANRLTAREGLHSKWQFTALEEMHDISRIIHTYGPMLADLQMEPKVAVYMPFRQSAYDDVDPKLPADSQTLTYDAIHKLLVAGFTADVLTDEMIDAGRLADYKVVILSGLRYTTAKYRKLLDDFAANGGRLFHDESTTMVPQGSTPLGVRFGDFMFAADQWTFNALPDDGHTYLFNRAKAAAPRIREMLDPVVPRFVQTDNPDILTATRTFGDATYTFVIDNLYPSWGANKGGPYGWETYEATLMPQRTSVLLRADAGPTYELFSQREMGTAKDGRKQIDVDMAYTPFRVFVTLPKPIAALEITSQPSAAPGELIAVKVRPLAADGAAINASIPLRVQLVDPAGRIDRELYRAADPEYAESLVLYTDSKPGRWLLRVKELVSGREAETPVQVAADAGTDRTIDQRLVRRLPDVILLKP
ncbi:MAG TPA: hypothetical protein VM223_01585, partial [Planctomycetota bacterium]|nr:hypothetical protein [Planctomycetota bacterium]